MSNHNKPSPAPAVAPEPDVVISNAAEGAIYLAWTTAAESKPEPVGGVAVVVPHRVDRHPIWPGLNFVPAAVIAKAGGLPSALQLEQLDRIPEHYVVQLAARTAIPALERWLAAEGRPGPRKVLEQALADRRAKREQAA